MVRGLQFLLLNIGASAVNGNALKHRHDKKDCSVHWVVFKSCRLAAMTIAQDFSMTIFYLQSKLVFQSHPISAD